MYIVALLVTAKFWKQPRWPSMGIVKHTVVHPYRENYWLRKRNKLYIYTHTQ